MVTGIEWRVGKGLPCPSMNELQTAYQDEGKEGHAHVYSKSLICPKMDLKRNNTLTEHRPDRPTHRCRCRQTKNRVKVNSFTRFRLILFEKFFTG